MLYKISLLVSPFVMNTQQKKKFSQISLHPGIVIYCISTLYLRSGIHLDNMISLAERFSCFRARTEIIFDKHRTRD